MKLNKIDKIEDYQQLTDAYRINKIFSNDYIQNEVSELISKGLLFEHRTESNLFLFVKRDFGMRMYYYIGNLEEVVDFSSIDNLVIEILYRGEKFYPQEEINYFCRSGFSVNLIRDQYSGMYKDLIKSNTSSSVNIGFAETIDEISWSCSLFNDSFDHLSGDYISDDNYNDLLLNKQIIVAKDDNGVLLGALHQTIDKGVAWISHVAVTLEARGKHVGQALLDEFIEKNYTTEKQRYMFWVQQQNTVAVNMYEKKGFKYLNKSTISLIKK